MCLEVWHKSAKWELKLYYFENHLTTESHITGFILKPTAWLPYYQHFDLSNTSWQPVVSLFIPCHNVWMPLARRGSFQSWPSWGDASLHSPGCAVCLGLSCTAVDLWSRSALQCLQRKYLLSSTEKAFSKDTPNIPVCKAGEHFYTKFTKIIWW